MRRRRSPPPRPSPIEGEGQLGRRPPVPPSPLAGEGRGGAASPRPPGRPPRAPTYDAKKYCSGRVLPGVRSGQSLPAVSGTLRSFWFATITPWTIGVRPTVPIS